MTEHPPFVKWPSIQRLSSETVYVTEKIDGTNGVIHVCDDGRVLAGSRERWLSLPDGTPCEKSKDNFTFSQWVYDRRDSLVRLGPGTHYGEFHGSGIQRGYGLKNKRFASFEYYRPLENREIHEDVDFVPVLFEGQWKVGTESDMVHDAIVDLRLHGSKMYPGFMKPEGIVITFKNMKTAKFKWLCENDEIHKYQQVKK